jgi:F-type H+-transporting ATPase subunit b
LSYLPTQFADSSGLGAFHVNLKDFVIQLFTFVIVLLVLRKWVVPKLVATMEQRQQTLENSLKQAKQTEEALARAETKVEEILSAARQQAAAERAALIIKDAETRLGEEREKLHQQLRGELAELVADATEKVIDEKLDAKRDMSLIERALKGVGR